MKTRLGNIVIGVTLLIVVGGTIVMTQKTQAPTQSNASSQEPQNQTAPSQEQVAAIGQYLPYSADAVAMTTGNIILFFHASWCPQCRTLDADISQNISAQNNLTIYKVDYDSNQSLRQKYGVTLQTTLVKIDSNGDIIKKYVAYDQPTLAAVKENLL